MKRMCEESKRLRSQAAIGVDERNEGKKKQRTPKPAQKSVLAFNAFHFKLISITFSVWSVDRTVYIRA